MRDNWVVGTEGPPDRKATMINRTTTEIVTVGITLSDILELGFNQLLSSGNGCPRIDEETKVRVVLVGERGNAGAWTNDRSSEYPGFSVGFSDDDGRLVHKVIGTDPVVCNITIRNHS